MPQSPLINPDFTFQKEEFSEHLNLEKYLVKVQARADKISDKFVIIFFIIGVLLAPIYQTWFFSLITGGSALLIYLLARFVLNNKFQARMLISAVYAVFMLQFIGQMHGMAETHFFFFVNAALLIIYQDWRIMLPYAILTVGHHSILAILQVTYGMDNLAYYFISYSGITITGETVAYVTVFQLVFHFTIISIMTVICGWWAVIFRQNSIFLMKNQIEVQVKNEQLITSDEELRQNIEELEAIQNKLNSVNNEMTYSMMDLENKNRVIEEKNLHITASINYAKRIQEAMLPKINRIEASLPNSFVFFKPKDIVSGDFYYYHEIDNKIIIAAIDCTGHGVPGAFMSLIGNELLNSILDKNIYTPADILTNLNQKIDKALNQTELSSRSTSDGMDAAICLIDFEANKLEYAGAKNPLVYVQNNEMNIIKADRASVGGNLTKKQKKQFTNHSISFDVPTSFYIYSDGFQDQFGGEEGRKFNIDKFRDALLNISTYPFSQQQEVLETIFENWRGNNKQIDDVLVIGFELTPS
ncbi:serine phosphatase RsbU, regulator of sigma subunit [Bernardetia litoralis DSM 6794]|uniref:Serine phosphatase RsbU, regulator of sigma subunit n=1 Tax=Bernardetia litoralis (strain ATCC 23117 / DSM 6794 / NBRC 15988 / NCIMB 1366 / Fx l1 / Sio-4) TaxID=880071 RepID=I4AH90_BERLS|nr:SpoIIE family protein phosphatase [Bernardetia litoralis]AFM03325.1 serine phosphatase RsbU, regulator of sigma subunit [Bernardetia litoralis DSM 6794]